MELLVSSPEKAAVATAVVETPERVHGGDKGTRPRWRQCHHPQTFDSEIQIHGKLC